MKRGTGSVKLPPVAPLARVRLHTDGCVDNGEFIIEDVKNKVAHTHDQHDKQLSPHWVPLDNCSTVNALKGGNIYPYTIASNVFPLQWNIFWYPHTYYFLIWWNIKCVALNAKEFAYFYLFAMEILCNKCQNIINTGKCRYIFTPLSPSTTFGTSDTLGFEITH